MDQLSAEWNSPDMPRRLDLFSLMDLDDTQIQKTLADVLLPLDASSSTTTVRPEVNNNRSEVVSSPASDTLNTPSPRSSPPPYYTIPANPRADTTPSLNCIMPTDPNDNLASTSTVIYPNTSAVFSQNTNPVHTSEGIYQVLTPVPTYLDAASMPYLNTPQEGKITTTASTVQISSVEKERTYTITSSTVSHEHYIPTMVAEYTPLQSSFSPLPSNAATSTSKHANLAALTSHHTPVLSKPSTLSKETYVTLSLPVVSYSRSIEYPGEKNVIMECNEDSLDNVIIIDPENGIDLGALVEKFEIGNNPMIANEYEQIIMSTNYEEMDVIDTNIEKEDNKESLPQGIIQEALKKAGKSNGRGRPVKTEEGSIAKKIDRKAAKFMDSEEVEELRRQRKIDLNRIASKRYRERKKNKQQENDTEIPALAIKNEKLKNKKFEMEMEIVSYRKRFKTAEQIQKYKNWIKMRGIVFNAF